MRAQSKRLIRCCAAIVLSFALQAQVPAPSALEIVRRSVERDWTDWGSLKNYTYQQTIESRQFGKDGRLSHWDSKTTEFMVLGERPYQRLIARDGKPLPAKEELEEKTKLDGEAEKRQHESASQRAKYEHERAEDRRYIREIPDAFTFKLLGNDTISGQPAWVIQADPKPDFHPQHSDAKVFTKVRAKIWIEQATYHWVKVDAEALDTLSFGFGLLRVARGASMHFEQTRVNGEVWLPSAALIRADARLALIKKMRAEFDVRYSGYRKFQSESKIEGTQ